MKIKDVQIDGFGVWSGMSVHTLPEGMTVFYGPNEAGKTTLMQFVRTMFYGFTAERRQRYLPPVFGGKPGGSLRVTGPGGGYEITRRTQLDDPTIIGQVAVTGSDGTTQGQHRLTSLLGSIDESIFTNVFAIGLRELQELSTLDDTTAADELYKLSSGLDRVSLVDVMRQLRAARTQICGATPEAGQIQGMMLRREKLKDELEQLTHSGRRWAELASQQKTQRDEIKDLNQRIDQATLESKIIETALQVRTPWAERDRLRIAVRELAARTDLPDDARERLNRLQVALDEKRKTLLEIKDQRRGLREKASHLPLRKGILSLANKIEAASEQGPWIAALQKQILQIETQVGNTTEQLLEDASRLGLNEEDRELLLNDKRLASLPDLSGQAISQLAGPARDVRVHATRLKQAKEHAANDKKEVERLSAQLDEFLALRQAKDLHKAIAKQNEHTSALRKLENAQERLEKLQKHHRELDGDAIELNTERVVPLQQGLFQHALFVGGGTAFTFGLLTVLGIMPYYNGPQTTGVFWALVGLFSIFAGYIFRQFDEKGLSTDLSECETQLEAIIHQIRKAEQERDEMQALIPEHGGSLEQQLKESEYELNQLEGMLPIAHNLQAAQQRYQSARKQGQSSSDALKAARVSWKRTLHSMGLAESLSPKSLRIMAEGYESLIQTRRRLKAQQDEMHQRRLELSALMQRIEGLTRQIDVAKDADSRSEPKRERRREEESLTARDDRNRKDKRSEHRDPESRSAQAKRNFVDDTDGILANAIDHESSSIDSPVLRLQELQGLLAQQQQYISQRKQLKNEDEELSRRQKALQRTIDKIVRTRQALLAELAVESPAQLDGLLELKQKHHKLLAQIEEQETRIRAILGGQVAYDAVQRQLEGGMQGGDLEKKWSTIEERVQQFKGRVSQLLQRQGEIAQEMKSLAADRRLLEVKLELATLEKQLELSAEHWRTLAVTSNLLEQVCEIYETERQPETLREASAFLKQLTDGKYVRVWTPLGKNALQIDNDKNQSLPLEVLSRGTREAVFIALRLSLAAAYSRRGVALPLILDDVLVNFDTGRATSAAKVLRDFAALGHQAIMFTCHEHIMRLFHDIGVQVRVLPAHGQTGEAKIYTPETRIAIEQPVFAPTPVYEATPEPVVIIEREIVDETPAVGVEPEPVVYETVLERIEVPEPIRRSRPKPRFKPKPVIDHVWYEHEPETLIEEALSDEGFIANLSTSPPWNWEAQAPQDFSDLPQLDQVEAIYEELPRVSNEAEAVVTQDGTPWWDNGSR